MKKIQNKGEGAKANPYIGVSATSAKDASSPRYRGDESSAQLIPVSSTSLGVGPPSTKLSRLRWWLAAEDAG